MRLDHPRPVELRQIDYDRIETSTKAETMSLYPDEPRGGRERSRSRDRRSKDESNPETPSSWADIREPSYIYPEDDFDDRYNKRPSDNSHSASGALPYPEEGGIYSMLPGDQSLYGYDDRQKPNHPTAPPAQGSSYQSSRDKKNDKLPGAFPEDDRHDKDEPRARFAEPPRDDKYNRKGYEDEDDKLKYLPQKYARQDDKGDKDKKKQGDDSKLQSLPQKYIRKYITGDDDSSSDSDTESDDEDHLAYGKPSVPRRPKKENTELAYGKGGGVPSASEPSSKREQATYGSYASGDRWDDKRDDKRGSTYGASRDDGYDQRKPANPSAPGYGQYGESSRQEDPNQRKPTYPPAPDYSQYYGGEPSRKEDSSQRKSEGSAADYIRASEAEAYGKDPRGSNPNVLTVEPSSRERDSSRDRRRDKSPGPRSSGDTLQVGGGSSRHREKSRERSRDRRRDKSPGPRSSGDTLTVDSGHKSKHREKSRERERKKEKSSDTLIVDSGRHRERSRDGRRDKSPQPPTGKMDSLTVGTGRLAGMTVAMAPASPLLESYYGTYQDCSPMPSPLLLASHNPSDDLRGLDALSSLSGDEDSKKRNRRARFHDPEDITTQIANALKGTRTPDTEPLIHILPSLTHEQVMELRVEYKRMVKTGSERKGVNVAKHIRARLKDEDPLLMKACYAVALGKWEGEAYWANFWYQGDKTRRELLIEALMGRSNYEISCIKDAFTDKKYDNSLTKCMKTELKEDKFKKAVLMVLEQRRMEEYDSYGRRVALDYGLVEQDADDLRRAVKSEKGGETMMISIVIQRSDAHLRAVLKEYEHHYRSNFARDALKKSGNLVVSSHIQDPPPSHDSHSNFSPGRAPRAHPKRRDQPTRPRRPPPPPRHLRLSQGRAPP